MPRDIVKNVWDELTDVEYVSPQPGIRYRFGPPVSPRADNDPRLNNQPWYHGSNFPTVVDTIPNKITKKPAKR